MRYIGYMLMTVGLVAGTLAAALAYQVSLGLADERLLGLRLSAPAGAFSPVEEPELAGRVAELHGEIDARERRAEVRLLPPVAPADPGELPAVPEVAAEPTGEQIVQEREALRPIGRPGDPLTPELLGLLRGRGVEHVRVQSFALGRWRLNWVFGLAVGGIVAGALLVRRSSRAALVAPVSAGGRTADPAALLDAIRRTVAEVRAQVSSAGTWEARRDVIVDRLGELQQEELPAFVASRPRLVAAQGLGGYAQLMDRFAAGERQINRAWSAAADNAEAEAIEALEAAGELLEEASGRMPKASSPSVA